MRCPEDGSEMELRSGRFGKFLASVNYPDVKFVVNLDRKGGIKYPAQPPVLSDLECEKCGEKLNVRRGKRGPWLGCSAFPKCRGRGSWAKLDEAKQKELEIQLAQNDKDHPPIIIEDLDGNVIPGRHARQRPHPPRRRGEPRVPPRSGRRTQRATQRDARRGIMRGACLDCPPTNAARN